MAELRDGSGVKVHTVQIAVARKLGIGEDPGYLDTTVKSGDPAFAPTWKMVMGVKEARLSEEDYTEEYYQRMRDSYRDNRSRWEEILALDELFLACYCRQGSFCHRYLLRDMLVKLGAEDAGEVEESRLL